MFDGKITKKIKMVLYHYYRKKYNFYRFQVFFLLIKTIRGLEMNATALDSYSVEQDEVSESEELVNK